MTGGVGQRQPTAASERELHAGGRGTTSPTTHLGSPCPQPLPRRRGRQNNASHAQRPRAPGARHPEGNPIVSTLTLLVALLLILVVLLVVGTVVFLVHRRPSLNGPVTAGVATVAALAAVLAVVLSAGGGR